jgi:hypothetical protein
LDHAKEQLALRGATEAETEETIRTSSWKPARHGRLECRREFVFKGKWHNAFYKIKQVRPIFVEEEVEIVVVTVYVYYYSGGEQ